MLRLKEMQSTFHPNWRSTGGISKLATGIDMPISSQFLHKHKSKESGRGVMYLSLENATSWDFKKSGRG